MKSNRTRIRIETHEVLILRTSASPPRNACQECQSDRLMVTPEAMVLTKANLKDIYLWIEKGRVHYAQSAEGTILCCIESILQAIGSEFAE